ERSYRQRGLLLCERCTPQPDIPTEPRRPRQDPDGRRQSWRGRRALPDRDHDRHEQGEQVPEVGTGGDLPRSGGRTVNRTAWGYHRRARRIAEGDRPGPERRGELCAEGRPARGPWFLRWQ